MYRTGPPMEQPAEAKLRECRSPSPKGLDGVVAVRIKAAIARRVRWFAAGLAVPPGSSLAQSGDGISPGWLAMVIGGVAAAGLPPHGRSARWRRNTGQTERTFASVNADA